MLLAKLEMHYIYMTVNNASIKENMPNETRRQKVEKSAFFPKYDNFLSHRRNALFILV